MAPACETDSPEGAADAASLQRIVATIGSFLGQEVFAEVTRRELAESRRLRLLRRFLPAQGDDGWRNTLFFALAALLFARNWFGSVASDARSPGSRRLYLVSLTRNNARAFAPVLEALRGHWAPDAALNSGRMALVRRLGCVLRHPSRGIATRIIAAEGHADPSIRLHQMLALSCAFLFDEDLSRDPPALVGVANDHSAATVALLEVAARKGIARFYVQHAAVTPHFPPLSVELALLEDRWSARIYEEAAARHQLPALPPERILFRPALQTGQAMRLPDLPPDDLRICIALSAHPDEAGLSRLLEDLSGNRRVSAIFLRPHPRMRLDRRLLSGHSGKVSRAAQDIAPADMAETVDLWIVANSAIAGDLLRARQAVLFCDGIDHLATDYYGFVRAGLLPRYDPELLAEPARLRRIFGAAWAAGLHALDPPQDARDPGGERLAASLLSAAAGKLLPGGGDS